MKAFKSYVLLIKLILIFLPVVLKAQTNQTVNAGSQTAIVNFPPGTCAYAWTNDSPAIGIAASGTGDIGSFIATNNTNAPIKATITATPISKEFAYIPNSTAGTVSVIDSYTQTIVATINTGIAPVGIVISADRQHVYITDMVTGTISFIDAATNTVSATVPGASTPMGIAITPDGKYIYVANSQSNNIWKINTSTRTVTQIPAGHASEVMVMSPDGTKVYAIHSGIVTVISTATDAVLDNITIDPLGTFFAVISPDGNNLYIGNTNLSYLEVVNTATRTVSQMLSVGLMRVTGMAISPDGNTLYVAISGVTVNVNNGKLDVNYIGGKTVTSIYLPTGTGRPNGGYSINSDYPVSLALSSDGQKLFITHQNTVTLKGGVTTVNTSNFINNGNIASGVIGDVDVGSDPIPIGNFVTSAVNCGPPITFTITVNPASSSNISITGAPSAVNTVYGTPSSSTSFIINGTNIAGGVLVTAPDGFEVSGSSGTIFGNSLTVGGIGSNTVRIRLKQTAAVGTYSGSITLSNANSSLLIAMPASTVTPAPLLITANDITKTYGKTLTGGPGATGYIASGLKNGETTGSVSILYGAGATATDGVGVYNASIMPAAITGGTFTASNYNLAYQMGNLTVAPAILIVTAENKSKISGAVNPMLTISYSGFVNNEGIAQITTQPIVTTTATQSSPVGTYPITVSGGIATNYSFNYINGVLTVNPAPITIPNTFTPNGDGINDTWNITNLNTYPKITVEILNRYGTRVYFSNNYSIPWDGRYNGAKVPEGTYYYIITGVNKAPLSGYVSVIR